MRKMCCPVVIFVMTFCSSAILSAETGSLPMPRAFAAVEQDNAAQSQGQPLTPEARAKLIRKIQGALIKLPYVTVFDNIEFILQDRTVILQGQVVNSINKPDAESAVKRVEGVEKVVNNIEVLPPAPVDDRLRHQVYDAIYKYGPLFKYSTNKVNPQIRIIVKNSRLTLEGIVDSEGDKNLCTLRANQVSGLLSVTNNLRVVK
ncbi:MAG TPA: BON domain-containing protein [Bryocella sp.]|nr:BON domain-containing protein [Bryocella sp.]